MKGVVMWLTGLPGSGKTTLAQALVRRFRTGDLKIEHLDTEDVRAFFPPGLGYTRTERDQVVRCAGRLANLLSKNGVHVVVSLISPYRDSRAWCRDLIGSRFVEVYVSAPVETCAERDTKGLYERAMAGDLAMFTGVNDPYEVPLQPEVIAPTSTYSAEACVESILDQFFRRLR